MNTNDNRLKAHKLIDHIFQDFFPPTVWHSVRSRSN